jgi:hypothetical protein
MGVEVSTISPQRGQTKTCRIVCWSATRADLDQAISTSQDLQIGEANSSSDFFSLYMERGPPAGTSTCTDNGPTFWF